MLKPDTQIGIHRVRHRHRQVLMCGSRRRGLIGGQEDMITDVALDLRSRKGH